MENKAKQRLMMRTMDEIFGSAETLKVAWLGSTGGSSWLDHAARVIEIHSVLEALKQGNCRTGRLTDQRDPTPTKGTVADWKAVLGGDGISAITLGHGRLEQLGGRNARRQDSDVIGAPGRHNGTL